MTLRVALVQVSAGTDVRQNQHKAEQLIREAAKNGAELVALPENFLFRGPSREMQELSLKLKPITLSFCRLAQELKIRLLLGSVPEPTGERGKVFNTSIFILPTGEVPVRYKKLHLFAATLPDGTQIDESQSSRGGNRVLTFKDGEWTFGFTVCYDLRFPELFRVQSQAGVNVFFVPANFTKATGTAHWQVLLRARAIENLAYVLAPAQCGFDPGHRIETYGHSLAVSPWGEIMAELGDAEGTGIAELNLQALSDARKRLPALTHRRTDMLKVEIRDRRAEAFAAQQPDPRG
ncbi:MAG: hypothetical protein A3G34_13025 [Candidatus Lindowbacteria bacterium RIFCSPLOWO2_12_FULL_62_27]|nr:MAG: hypothetical protein A3I06_15030 [Candidatus Lindowbacteria bacterium RIFCSPLOWO2_02_FULL_62_12]OGH62507.1 MAG: hypothetical protein A3G34_13025 [Candidatus Lindowbacteria bacterium RIFCSPLOWO2_12_FULL_62_27]